MMAPRMPTTLTPEALLADRRWIEDLARRLVRDPNAADDVAQETWRRVLERPPARLSSPRGWLRSVVRSCARERRRGDARRQARERAASRPESTPGAAHLVARADAQRTVLDAVLALDPASREVVLLRYFEDLEPWEIARRVGAPPGTVRSRLHRALAELRKRLDDRHGGDSAAWGAALLGPQWRGAARSAGDSTLSKGVLVMTTQTKTALGAAAVLALLLLWWRADGAAPAPRCEGTRHAGSGGHHRRPGRRGQVGHGAGAGAAPRLSTGRYRRALSRRRVGGPRIMRRPRGRQRPRRGPRADPGRARG